MKACGTHFGGKQVSFAVLLHKVNISGECQQKPGILGKNFDKREWNAVNVQRNRED